jgi:hypothetical protein
MLRRGREGEGRGNPSGTSMIPRRAGRPGAESIVVRLIATGGIIGIGTALAAILGSQDVHHWVTGLAVATVSVVLAAVLWSSRML